MSGFSFSDLFSVLEEVATGIAAGAANSNTPLATIDATHPITTAAVDGGMLAGKALATALPQASMVANIALQIAQAWATANAPAPAAAHS